MIAQRFEFTRHFPKAWNNIAYFQLRKMSCGFKDQARFCSSGDKCGLAARSGILSEMTDHVLCIPADLGE